MLVADVKKLINERKIVACNICDLRAIKIVKSDNEFKYKFMAKKLDIAGLNSKTTFLYKIDDTHYIEYYSKCIITVIDNYTLDSINNCIEFDTFKEVYEQNYKKNPIVVLNRDLEKIGSTEMAAFRENAYLNNYSIERIREDIETAIDGLYNLFKIVTLEVEKENYALNVYKELNGKKSYIIRISDIANIGIHIKDYDGNFRYKFQDENRTSFKTLETTNYTILTAVPGLENFILEEYYTKSKILLLIKHTKKIFNPENFNDFNNSYEFLLEKPFIYAGELLPYDDSTKLLISENYQKDGEIKEIIEDNRAKAISNLKSKYAKIRGIDEYDAYVDDALINMVLELKKENTDD